MTTVASTVTASQADIDAIERAAMDYLEGFVTGDADRHQRAYHPECLKRRFTTDAESGIDGLTVISPATMVEWADSGRTVVDGCDVDVFIDDVYGDIASVRIYSCNWVDFVHVVKGRSEWKLFHVTWQGRS